MFWVLYIVGLILIGCANQRTVAPDISPVEVSSDPTSTQSPTGTPTPELTATGTPTPELTPTSTPDGDGWTVAEGDCNDTDWLIHPDVPEVCDGVDQNCNGQIDEGVTTYVFWDVDGDRHPAYTAPVMAGCKTTLESEQMSMGHWPAAEDWDICDTDPTNLVVPCPAPL